MRVGRSELLCFHNKIFSLTLFGAEPFDEACSGGQERGIGDPHPVRRFQEEEILGRPTTQAIVEVRWCRPESPVISTANRRRCDHARKKCGSVRTYRAPARRGAACAPRGTNPRNRGTCGSSRAGSVRSPTTEPPRPAATSRRPPHKPAAGCRGKSRTAPKPTRDGISSEQQAENRAPSIRHRLPSPSARRRRRQSRSNDTPCDGRSAPQQKCRITARRGQVRASHQRPPHGVFLPWPAANLRVACIHESNILNA